MDPNNQQPDAAVDTGTQNNSPAQDQVDDWSSAEADFLADKGVKVEEKKDPADEKKPEDTNKPANPTDNPEHCHCQKK